MFLTLALDLALDLALKQGPRLLKDFTKYIIDFRYYIFFLITCLSNGIF